jgi:hypothetical protein
MKLIKNKRGNIGKEWMFALAFIFALSIIYLTFNMVFNIHLAPIFIEQLPDTDTGLDARDGILFWLTIWKIFPYILLGLVLVYMFILSVKKESVERSW